MNLEWHLKNQEVCFTVITNAKIYCIGSRNQTLLNLDSSPNNKYELRDLSVPEKSRGTPIPSYIQNFGSLQTSKPAKKKVNFDIF